MFTIGSRLFYGLAFASLVLALAYLLGSDSAFLGTTILLVASAASCFMGAMVTAFRDADPDAQLAVLAGPDALDAGGAPTGATPWPMVAGAAGLIMAIGLVLDTRVFVGGLILAVAVVLEWMVAAWADRASADPAYNQRIRDQLMQPLEVPLAAAVIAGLVVFGFSRVMLATSHSAGPWIFIGIGVAIMAVAVVVAVQPKLGARALGAIALVGAGGMLAAGVVAAAVGERTFHHEEPEGVASVDNQSAAFATIGWDGEALDLLDLNIPKAVPITLLFENRSEEEAALVVELGPDAEGEMQTISTNLREGPAQQAVTFRLLRPGEFRYYVEGHEEEAGVITVLGALPATTTTTAG